MLDYKLGRGQTWVKNTLHIHRHRAIQVDGVFDVFVGSIKKIGFCINIAYFRILSI